jgi:hypothetical protein
MREMMKRTATHRLMNTIAADGLGNSGGKMGIG